VVRGPSNCWFFQVVESGLFRPGTIRFGGLIRWPSRMRGGLRDWAPTSEPLHP
jgi:hypothetical protein